MTFARQPIDGVVGHDIDIGVLVRSHGTAAQRAIQLGQAGDRVVQHVVDGGVDVQRPVGDTRSDQAVDVQGFGIDENRPDRGHRTGRFRQFVAFVIPRDIDRVIECANLVFGHVGMCPHEVEDVIVVGLVACEQVRVGIDRVLRQVGQRIGRCKEEIATRVDRDRMSVDVAAEDIDRPVFGPQGHAATQVVDIAAHVDIGGRARVDPRIVADVDLRRHLVGRACIDLCEFGQELRAGQRIPRRSALQQVRIGEDLRPVVDDLPRIDEWDLHIADLDAQRGVVDHLDQRIADGVHVPGPDQVIADDVNAATAGKDVLHHGEIGLCEATAGRLQIGKAGVQRGNLDV